jgi:hypothetical protein
MAGLVTRGADDTPLAIHRTFLTRNGGGKAPVVRDVSSQRSSRASPRACFLFVCCGFTSIAGRRPIHVRKSSASTRVRRPRLTARSSPDLIAS